MDALQLALATAAQDGADRPALIAEGTCFSHADLAARVLGTADVLAREGVTAGSRVALIAPNSVEAVIAIHALIALGATLVPVHSRLTPTEVDALLADAAPDRGHKRSKARSASSRRRAPGPPGPLVPPHAARARPRVPPPAVLGAPPPALRHLAPASAPSAAAAPPRTRTPSGLGPAPVRAEAARWATPEARGSRSRRSAVARR